MLRKAAFALVGLVLIGGAALGWRTYSRQREFRQLAARAERGDAEAQFRLGSAYFYGEGTHRNYPEAVRWYRRSADQGVTKAQYAVAYCYRNGRGVSRDLDKAVYWCRRAADHGDALAQRVLADAYSDGRGVPQDYAEAFRLALRAAQQGDAPAQLFTGDAYRWGSGVPRNEAESFRWYLRAAVQGNASAQWRVSEAYQSGIGIRRDSGQAALWRLKAIARAAGQSAARLGWSTLVSLLLVLAFLVVPKRRWGRAQWLRWAVLSAATAVMAVHEASGSPWSAPVRIVMVALFALFSAALAVGALMEARRASNAGPA